MTEETDICFGCKKKFPVAELYTSDCDCGVYRGVCIHDRMDEELRCGQCFTDYEVDVSASIADHAYDMARDF